MFSMTPNRGIMLKSMHVRSIFKGIGRVTVYTKPGTYKGYEVDDRAWTIVYNNFNDLKGPEEDTRLDLNNDRGVFIEAFQLTSFFIYTGSRVMCWTGMGAGDVMAQDFVVELYQGIALDGKWAGSGGDGAPLAFSGALE